MNWHRWLVGIFILAAIVSATIGIFIGRTFKPDISNNPLLLSGLRQPAKQLDAVFSTVLSKTPAELEQTDVATLYFSCLAGLPGTENLDLEHARAHFTELAKMAKSRTENAITYQHRLRSDFKDTSAFRSLVLMQILKAYEQLTKEDAGTSLPENLFARNKVDLVASQHFTNPVQAALAGQPFGYRPALPEDSILELPHMQDAGNLNNPILVLVIGRLLGYPVYLVNAPDHFFVRWQSDDGKSIFDLDDAGQSGSILDDPVHPDSDDIPSLTHADLTALFLFWRGNLMRKQQRGFDAELAFIAAHRFAPNNPVYKEKMMELVGEEMQIRGMKWKDIAEHNGYYLNLSSPKPDKTVIP